MSGNLHLLAEARSLALHRRVAQRIVEQPALLDRARARVQGWLQHGGVARPYAEAWERLLAGEPVEVAATLVDESERMTALRQTTPFSFVVPPRERWQIWKDVRRSWEKTTAPAAPSNAAPQ